MATPKQENKQKKRKSVVVDKSLKVADKPLKRKVSKKPAKSTKTVKKSVGKVSAGKRIVKIVKKVVDKEFQTTAQRKDSGDFDKSEEYFLRWQAVDFAKNLQQLDWYYVAIPVIVFIILGFLFTRNPIPALTFVVVLAVIIIDLKNQPQLIEYEVNMDGVVMGEQFFSFSEIRSFSMVQRDGYSIVQLNLRSGLFPIKELVLEEGADLIYTEALFSHFLPQQEQEWSVLNINSKKSDSELSEDEFIDKVVDAYVRKNK